MKTRRFVFAALCVALLVISKEMIAALPNVELVSFLFILIAIHFSLKDSILIATIFCIIQAVLYGMGDWTIMYFLIWNGLVVLSYHLRFFLHNEYRAAFFSGIFGLVFGFLFSSFYLIYSVRFMWVYFLRGLPFDLLHGITNFIIMLILYQPFRKVFNTIKIEIDKD
ncbi:MAG: ECF transporter S component [Breznakia sp.]